MLDTTKQAQLQELLDTAQSVLVLLGERPTGDECAAALGLTDSLKEAGKAVALAAPKRPQTKLGLIGLEQFSTELGNQNLSISFSYSQEAVDKVSYHISDDNARFFLTVKPKKGSKPLSADSVVVGYAGTEAELIFIIGVQTLAELGALFTANQDLYTATPIVAVGERSAEYGVLQLTMSDEVGVSQLIAGSLLDVGMRPSSIAATNLLAGIESTTGNLQSSKTTAETFEVVARLMRAGAERVKNAPRTESSLDAGETEVTPAKSSKQHTVQIAHNPVKRDNTKS